MPHPGDRHCYRPQHRCLLEIPPPCACWVRNVMPRMLRGRVLSSCGTVQEESCWGRCLGEDVTGSREKAFDGAKEESWSCRSGMGQSKPWHCYHFHYPSHFLCCSCLIRGQMMTMGLRVQNPSRSSCRRQKNRILVQLGRRRLPRT